MVATATGKITRRIMYREMRRAMGPRRCASCARVMGRVAMRIQVDTCARNEKRPDCERARIPVPKAMEDEIMCVVALE